MSLRNICINLCRNQVLQQQWLPRSCTPTFNNARLFSCTSQRRLKEIDVTKEEDTIKIRGVYKDEANKTVLPAPKGCEGMCPVCPHKLGVELKYTDVLVLSQFVRADGCLLPRFVTGVCSKGQSRLKELIRWSQRAGLMPELRPETKKGRDWNKHQSNYKWKQFNIYYGKYGEVQ